MSVRRKKNMEKFWDTKYIMIVQLWRTVYRNIALHTLQLRSHCSAIYFAFFLLCASCASPSTELLPLTPTHTTNSSIIIDAVGILFFLLCFYRYNKLPLISFLSKILNYILIEKYWINWILHRNCLRSLLPKFKLTDFWNSSEIQNF